MCIFLFRRIHIHPQDFCLWETSSHHLLDLLRSGLKFSDKTGPALRADPNLRLLISTVMADHFPSFMNGKGYIAVWTLDHMSTFPAGHKSRISTPVQKQYDLLSPLQPLFHQTLQLSAQDRMIPVLQFFPHIYSIHLCHLLHSGTMPHFIQNILTLPRPVHRLHRGRRTSKDNACILFFCSLDRSFPCMIPGNLLTFVSRLMFLVDHHQSKIRKWCKQGRAGTDHHIDLSPLCTHHLIITFPRRKPGIHN